MVIIGCGNVENTLDFPFHRYHWYVLSASYLVSREVSFLHHYCQKTKWGIYISFTTTSLE
jgi:hypothetical protein